MALDVGGDGHRLNLPKREPSGLAPTEELTNGLGVGRPGVLVPDVRREELQEAFCRVVPRLGDEDREHGAGDTFLKLGAHRVVPGCE